jgi:hydroxymethylglutaryl-CoA lyase
VNDKKMIRTMADVTIVDTSPRDGPVALPKIGTPEKVALAKRLMQSGLTKIDCVAFTHPRIRPEFADAEEVISTLDTKPEVTIIGLAPNEIACRRALSTNVDEIGVNTGINLDAIVDSVKLAQKLARRELAGHVLKVRTVFEFSNFPEPLKLN